MATLNGTYGGNQTPCTVYTYETRQGTWYAAEGSHNANLTHDELCDGVNIELLADHDTFSASKPINSESELERQANL